ncbi:MAG: ribonuclease D [Coriobacteriales bacterium]|nr:ribonuclease D [Coriobacteriales bacterium]
MYISTSDELEAFCERARSHAVLAVDTEFLRERTYHPRLCLIQVATHDEAVAIDPLLIDDLSPLVQLLTDSSKTKVFHACGQDLEAIYAAMGCMPEPVFDTQLAAAFLGHRMQLGYAALVKSYENVRLDKADGLTDWSRRPLDADQLRYAEEDVLYLPRIYDRMMSDLIARDRLSWFVPEMEGLCDPARFIREPQDAYQHLKRASTLTRRQLAVAREVCAWRETCAAKRDLPRKWVISDEVIVELCRRAPRDTAKLRRIRGTSQLSERDASDLIRAVLKGLKCDPQNYPSLPHRGRSNADSDGVVDLMYALLRIRSEQCGVAIPLIATRDDLCSFAAGDKSSPLVDGWRYELVGDRLRRLLAGEIGLTVKDGRIEIL